MGWRREGRRITVRVTTAEEAARLVAGRLKLIEVAPGGDVERYILACMDFRPGRPLLKEAEQRLRRGHCVDVILAYVRER
jgi:acyl CoA:acetate/3-ketoacid CoA transferase